MQEIEFSDFPAFDGTSCWEGAVLAWYPDANRIDWPFGLLKCSSKDHFFNGVCLSEKPGTICFHDYVLYRK